MKFKSLFWMQIGLLVCNLNFMTQIKNGLPLLAISLIFTKWFFEYKKLNPFRPIYMNLAAIVALIVVAIMYKGTLGQESSISFLILLSSLKNLEVKKERDEKFLKLLLLLNVASQFIFSFDPLPLLLGVVSLFCFLRAMNPEFKYRSISLSLIIMTCFLFIFFPRLSNPFKIRGFESSSYSSGFTDDMSPGSIENVVKNKSVAFYAQFYSTPKLNNPYWKGQVLREAYGLTWKRKSRILRKNVPVNLDKKPDYEVTLEPHNAQWLYSLQNTEVVSIQELGSTLREGDYFESPEPIRKSLIYKGWFGYTKDSPTEQDFQLPKKLPENFLLLSNDITLGEDSKNIINKIEELIIKRKFKYSLSPGKSSSDLESFINSKVGFCEHYAALSSLLLRMHKVPARVVIGYQGGKYVQNAQVWKYTNADAHAWTEYWVDGEWKIFDLTTVLAPERLILGGELFSLIPEELIGTKEAIEFAQNRAQDWIESMKNSLDAIQYNFTYFFLTYDITAQTEFINKIFSSFGFLLLSALLLWGIVHFLRMMKIESKNPLMIHMKKLSKKLNTEFSADMTLGEWKALLIHKNSKFCDPSDLDFIFTELEKSIYSPHWSLKDASYVKALKLAKSISIK